MKKFLPAVAANLSATLSEILLMASSAWLIASAALHPPLGSLSVGITLVRTAGILRAVLRYADRFLSHKIIFEILDNLREELYGKAAKIFPLKSGVFYEGELLHALTVTADSLKNFLPSVVLPLSTAAITTALLTFFLSETIGLVSLILPTFFFIVIFASLLRKVEDANDSIYREKILDFYPASDELKIFGKTPAISQLDKIANFFGREQMRLNFSRINFDTAANIFCAAGICILLSKLCAVADKIELTVWSLILLAVLEIYSTVPEAVRSFKKIRRATNELEKNFTADKAKKILPDVEKIPQENYAVKFDNVTFGYNYARPILKNFNLQIPQGKIFQIVGESGAGKTTLLYLMTGLFQPDNGTVKVNGKISAATSTNFIFSKSIRYNFELLNEGIDEKKIFESLNICRLENFDIDSTIGEDGAKLSGGERNRLQVALAVATDSDILILDEPTAGLNKNLAEKFLRSVEYDSRKKNRTLIIITHDEINSSTEKFSFHSV